MIRLLRVTLWLSVGAVAVAGLYWAFLNTPESNTLMLAASALLTLITVLVAGVVVNTGIHLAAGDAFAPSIRRAPRGLPWFAAALAIVALGWWAVLRGDAWVAAHQGEISAWFIAQLNWSDVSRLFWADAWLSRWLRWVAIPLTALSLLAGWLRAGAGAGWWRRVWNIRAIAVSTLVFLVLFALPLQLVDWRPAMPPNWMEPTIAAARLGVVALCLALGAAVLVMLASRPDAPVAAVPVANVPQ
ncbi:MAG TPA: hypothetical protein VNJ02_16350 [Vicinamibacterales bacterium]|nr:hypothetical protein [Vicinamibacterales bacterium]